MNRKIAFLLDYWLGRMICAVISVVYMSGKLFRKGKTLCTVPKKILFLELSEMGAAILAYSAIKEAKAFEPSPELYFWIFKENAESVYALNIIPPENIITTRTANIFLLLMDTIRNIIRLRTEGIDAVIDMELFSRFTSILTYAVGAKNRIGFYKYNMEGLGRADIYTHKVMYNPYNHISKNFLALTRALRSDGEDLMLKETLYSYDTKVPSVEPTESDVDNIWEKLKQENSAIDKNSKIVILNPGMGEFLSLRRWPVENYIELAYRMLEDEGTFVVLVGLRPEVAGMAKVDNLSNNDRFINLIGKTTVSEFITLCNIASLFVSHDSGAVNLASLTPIDTVVLFGPETPVLYEPLKANKIVIYKKLACSPCFSAYNHRISSCRNNKCLKMITVDEVCDAIEELRINGDSLLGHKKDSNRLLFSL